jgi:hypothetical protein
MAPQSDASAAQAMVSQQGASAAQPNAQNTWSPQMAAQSNALAPPPMTPQQHLAILLHPKSPSEILISKSPHQGGINWVFQDQATGILRYVNVPYMDSTCQQSASPSAPQPATTSALAMTQQSPNRVAQRAHQMASAGQPMTQQTWYLLSRYR